jgi:hypothetical protein
MACEVIHVHWVKAARQKSGTYSTELGLCDGTDNFWVKVSWTSAGGENYPLWEKDWLVEIWQPGEPSGSGEGYPPSGLCLYTNDFDWDIDEDDPQTGSSKEAVFSVPAVSLEPGTYQIRAWVKRVDTSAPNEWEYSHQPCTIHVIRVIADGPPKVLAYTGSYAGSEPPETYTALGTPYGGTYSWSWANPQPGDTGAITFVSGQNGPVATIRGTSPSSRRNDVDLMVTYTFQGASCTTGVLLTVQRPYHTLAYGGDCLRSPDGKRWTRSYYHVVNDQFLDPIDKEGIPFDEYLTLIYGPIPPTPESGSTLLWDEDLGDYGEWWGGVAVKDILSCPYDVSDTIYYQILIGGGWTTTPGFYLYFRPTAYPPVEPCIYKRLWLSYL